MSELPRLAKRKADSHKGDYGRVLLIGGSRGMAGSISLSAMACLRSGAGLVTVATSTACLDTVAGFDPSYMTMPLPADAEGRIDGSLAGFLEGRLEQFDCVALGPGLGRSHSLSKWVAHLYESCPAPLVIDADGLNALAEQDLDLTKHAGARILTPHPGEMHRLALQFCPPDEKLPQAAALLAGDHGLTLVLKGHETLVTNGTDSYQNTTGNPGMATGGMGDVLTGILAALVAQRLSPFDACRLGVYIHGRAGDLAAATLGQTSLIASDLCAYLAPAFREQESRDGK